jgi:hypothetical protein
MRRPRCRRTPVLRALASTAGRLTATGALWLAAPQDPVQGQTAPPLMQQLEVHANPHGAVGVYLPGGPIALTDNAFFRPFGTNGRSCATCHRPSSGMSLSLRDVRESFAATGGAGPLFAHVDGVDCPSRLPGGDGGTTPESASSLLLSRATIRISLPWPPRDELGNAKPAEFDLRISPGEDPSGCNLDPAYGLAAGYVSVYRRPPMVAQMNLKTVRPDGTGPVLAGSVAWDGRELSLEQQAYGAARGHEQAVRDPTAEELAQVVQFAGDVRSAQLVDAEIGPLDADGARGGPVNLAAQLPALGSGVTFDEFDNWAAQTGKRQSINRGQFVFNVRRFTVSDVAGFNDLPGGFNPSRGVTCSTCHNLRHAGSDFLANRQSDIGVGGTARFIGGPAPAEDLPRFTLTCHAGVTPGFLGHGPIVTNDPGLALITGKCADIGKFTVPQLRALAAREPYFHDGSAATLEEVVDFYDQRFNMRLSDRDKLDLVNFMAAL